MPKLTLEECLAENGFLTYRIRGVSMQPMLRQGRDLFTVIPKGPERCKKYDVVLYRRQSDPYVLHRIIEVRPDSYVILGDNCIAKEYGIRDEDILGVLTSFGTTAIRCPCPTGGIGFTAASGSFFSRCASFASV